MKYSIQVAIVTTSAEEKSYILNQIGDNVKNELKIIPEYSYQKTEGGKSGVGLADGLLIAELSLTAIGTLIAILAYIKSQSPKYSVKYKVGEAEVHASNLNRAEYEEEIKKLSEKNPRAIHKVELIDSEDNGN